ncbi:hypothetical protein PWT90_08564 [Aphanocladium album]|nr:hypothetical protein PWT90_08564 [Aphanocladium album]
MALECVGAWAPECELDTQHFGAALGLGWDICSLSARFQLRRGIATLYLRRFDDEETGRSTLFFFSFFFFIGEAGGQAAVKKPANAATHPVETASRSVPATSDTPDGQSASVAVLPSSNTDTTAAGSCMQWLRTSWLCHLFASISVLP